MTQLIYNINSTIVRTTMSILATVWSISSGIFVCHKNYEHNIIVHILYTVIEYARMNIANLLQNAITPTHCK